MAPSDRPAISRGARAEVSGCTRSSKVARSTAPVWGNPRPAWNCRTASAVAAPNRPSITTCTSWRQSHSWTNLALAPIAPRAISPAKTHSFIVGLCVVGPLTGRKGQGAGQVSRTSERQAIGAIQVGRQPSQILVLRQPAVLNVRSPVPIHVPYPQLQRLIVDRPIGILPVPQQTLLHPTLQHPELDREIRGLA